MTQIEQTWAAIENDELERPDVTAGTGFGRSEGLRVRGKIFAIFMGSELVVKLPRDRVDELCSSGAGHRFDANRGRPMKEWVVLHANTTRRCRRLVDEARVFVARP